MPRSSKVSPEQFARSRFRFFTPTPTRWGDCDRLGHVNNVQFVRYFESGRLDYFHRLLDMELGPDVVDGLIIADLHVNFLQQIHHPSALEVGTRQIAVVELNADLESGVVGEPIMNLAFDIPTTAGLFGNSLYAVNAKFTTPQTPGLPFEVVRVDRN